jgi:hypothetical protein
VGPDATYACSPKTQEAEAKGSEFRVGLGGIARHCRNKTEKKNTYM